MTKTLNMVQGENWKYSGETISVYFWNFPVVFFHPENKNKKKSWTSWFLVKADGLNVNSNRPPCKGLREKSQGLARSQLLFLPPSTTCTKHPVYVAEWLSQALETQAENLTLGTRSQTSPVSKGRQIQTSRGAETLQWQASDKGHAGPESMWPEIRK